MENKIIEQSDYGDLEIQNNTEDGIAVVWQFNENTDRIIIERDKTREAAFAICPELHSELETIKEQNKKLTDCVNAGIELAKSAETIASSLEKAIELLKDAELCLEVQLQDVIYRGSIASLLQRIKSGTTFLEGRKQD